VICSALLAAVRKTVRPLGKRLRLGPLTFLDAVQGRFVALLPRTGELH
jgi:hypothetical protein